MEIFLKEQNQNYLRKSELCTFNPRVHYVLKLHICILEPESLEPRNLRDYLVLSLLPSNKEIENQKQQTWLRYQIRFVFPFYLFVAVSILTSSKNFWQLDAFFETYFITFSCLGHSITPGILHYAFLTISLLVYFLPCWTKKTWNELAKCF